MRTLKVSIKWPDEFDEGGADEVIESFGLLARAIDVNTYSAVAQFDGWFECNFTVLDYRVQLLLDFINGLTMFEAEEIK